MDEWEQKGYEDRRGFLTSPNFAWLPRDIDIDLAMRIYMPNIPQDLMQVQRPLPAKWKAWQTGWNKAVSEEKD